MGKIELVKGDITKIHADAIVNAANKSLMGGGGVDGAIHRAGGKEILEACRAHVKTHGECPTGYAVVTTSGRLPSKFLIHTVGPIWKGGEYGEKNLLYACYYNSLNEARKIKLKSIAFPNISTGVYGYPLEAAAQVAIKAVQDYMQEHDEPSEIIFVCHSEENYSLYKKLLNIEDKK